MITREMTPEEKLEYCQSVIESQESSGLTIAKWCKENGVSPARFYRYKRYVKGEERDSGEPAQEMAAEETEQDEATITVEAGGVRVLISRDSDWETVCRVMKAMGASC